MVGRGNDALPGFVLMCRVVLALMGLLLVVMPWSEQYSTFDNFPHGQDAEVGLLGFFIMLGLVLLFARSCSRAITALLVVFFVALSMAGVRQGQGAEPAQRMTRATVSGPPIPGGNPGSFNVPLQI